MAIFLFPQNIPSGGVAGIAIICNALFNAPYSWVIWLVNVPLLLAAIQWLGISCLLKTIYAVTVTAVTIDVLKSEIMNPVGPWWVDLLCGALLFGLGVGMLFRAGASSGGMSILAKILAPKLNRSPGKVMFWINLIIFLITASVVGWKIILMAIVCQWCSTRIIDAVPVTTRVLPKFVERYS